MQPFDAAGNVLNARYSVIPDGTRVALIMESRSGRAAATPGRNADYNPALAILLERLGRLDATLVDALVDSRRTQMLGTPEAERRIIRGPIRLAQVPDVEALRVQMGTAQAKVAQAADATKGGNSTKRIRLVLDIPGYGPDQADRLADAIAVPTHELVAPRAIRDRLDAIDDEKPTEADYAAAVSAIEGDLDRAVQTARHCSCRHVRVPVRMRRAIRARLYLRRRRRPTHHQPGRRVLRACPCLRTSAPCWQGLRTTHGRPRRLLRLASG